MKEIEAKLLLTYNEEVLGKDKQNIKDLFEVSPSMALLEEIKRGADAGQTYTDPMEWVIRMFQGVSGNVIAAFAVVGVNTIARDVHAAAQEFEKEMLNGSKKAE